VVVSGKVPRSRGARPPAVEPGVAKSEVETFEEKERIESFDTLA
jgi:hypothetical protein